MLLSLIGSKFICVRVKLRLVPKSNVLRCKMMGGAITITFGCGRPVSIPRVCMSSRYEWRNKLIFITCIMLLWLLEMKMHYNHYK